jgi:hypothetical protein
MHCSLHGQRWLLLILLCCVAVASADPVPGSLVWDGTPTATDLSTYCESEGISCGASIYDSESFTVTSPGAFLLSTTISGEFSALSCLPDGCYSSANLEGEWYGDTELYVAGTVAPVFGQYLSDSGSNTCTAIPDPPYPPSCEVSVSVGPDAETDVVTLGLGEYTIYDLYNVYASGGEAEGNATFDTNIVPAPVPDPAVVPEPRDGLAILGVAFLIALGLKARRTIRVQ